MPALGTANLQAEQCVSGPPAEGNFEKDSKRQAWTFSSSGWLFVYHFGEAGTAFLETVPVYNFSSSSSQIRQCRSQIATFVRSGVVRALKELHKEKYAHTLSETPGSAVSPWPAVQISAEAHHCCNLSTHSQGCAQGQLKLVAWRSARKALGSLDERKAELWLCFAERCMP